MAIVKKISTGSTPTTTAAERLSLTDLVPSYGWETKSGESRTGLKLHFVTFLPERAEGGKTQPAQVGGFLDSLTDPVTGSVREGRDCVPLRVTGASAVVLASRVFKDGFDPSLKSTLPTGSVFLETRPEAAVSALRGEDGELLAVYADGATLTGRTLYVPAAEFEEDDE